MMLGLRVVEPELEVVSLFHSPDVALDKPL